MNPDLHSTDATRLPQDESEERFRSILASMAEGVVFLDAEGRITFCNPGAERILGLSADQILGNNPRDPTWTVIREDGSLFPSAEQPARVTLRTGRPCTGVIMGLHRPDGKTIWISVNSEPLRRSGEPAPFGVVSTFTDVTQQRQAGVALKESEKLFRTLVETQQEGIGIVDLDERFLFANPAGEAIFGVPPGGLLGRSLLDFLPLASADLVRRQTESRIAGTPSLYELHFTRESDRCPRIILVSAAPYLNDSGRIAGAVGVFRDITDRKTVESSLQASEERLRLATEAIRLGTFDVNLQTGERIWSDLTRQFFGFLPGAEITTEDFIDAVHPDDRQRVRVELAALFNPGDGKSSSEFRTIDAQNGRERWVSSWGQTFFDEQRRPVRLVGVTLDVTERKRAEEALRESQARLQLTFDQAPIGAAMVSPGFRFLQANDALCRFLGYTADELIGKTIAEVTHPEHRTSNLEQGRLMIEGQLDLVRADKRYLRKDGSVVWAHITVRLLKDPSGRALYFITMVEDITERKRAAEEQERLQAQLAQAQKMESIGRLAGGVAHDFNNLLTVINGYSTLALQRIPPSDPLARTIEEILRAGETAAALIRQLLAFSRKQVLRQEPVSLNQMVGGMEKMLVRLMGDDVEIVTRLLPSLELVLADRHQIEQVILNLAVNGRAAMPQGGTLTIETDRVNWGNYCPHCLDTVRPGQYVRVTVSDTGIGMDAETRRHLFEPFFTTKEIGHGTGLGLATVHGIILQSGGHIDVESQPGQGTSFRIYLPAVEACVALAPAPEEAAALPPQTGTETILLVEDQDEVRQFAAAVLQQYGYRVLLAASADDALLQCAGQTVDLLLTDVVMPRTSGCELAAELLSRQPLTKVLFMSGYSEEMLLEHGDAMNGAMLLQKPFTPAVLAAKVREVLGGTDSSGRQALL